MDYKYLKYLKKKSIQNLWSAHIIPGKKEYDFIITIPCYNEYNYIFETLNSISHQKQLLLNNLLVIIIINNSENEVEEIKKNNDFTYQKIIQKKYNFEFVVVDSYSKGKALKNKIAGVGIARKIGCDIGLKYSHANSLFCFIDADTKINSHYLQSISSSYKKYNWKAATVMFEHMNDEPKTIKIIKEYEKFLNTTSVLLEKNGSPYNYIPIGSSMICNVKSYVSVGGMNSRKAAEDFYFLQELEKAFGVFKIKEVLVYPSSRYTPRAYLGTSSRLLKCLDNKLTMDSLYYTDYSFKILNKWLLLALKSEKKSYGKISKECDSLDKKLMIFLEQHNFRNAWRAINQAPTSAHFKKQFHRWFDGFKTFKLLKYYSFD